MATVKSVWVFNEALSGTFEIEELISINFAVCQTGEQFAGILIIPGGTALVYVPIDTDPYEVYVGYWVDSKYRTIDFGETEQTITDAQYEWLVGNAVPYADPNGRKYTIKHGTLIAIGDAIRGKLNTDTKYDPVDMPQAIEEIGGEYDEGYEQGKADAIANLPDGYLKIDPEWTSWFHLFNARTSMAQNLKYSDSANVTNMQSAFQNWVSTSVSLTIPSLDLRNVTTIQSMFLYSRGIVEIGEMNIPNVTNTQTAFNGCSNLQRISFVPGCIKVSIGFPSSDLLDDASIQSVIDGLEDLTGAGTQTVTFHATVGAKLTDEQRASITAKNWTLAY